MNVYTLQPRVAPPTQAIRDALKLPAHTTHVRWLIAADNHNWVVYQLRQRGWPDMPTTQTGVHLAHGRDVDALAGAGLLAERAVLVTPDILVGSGLVVAAVDAGGAVRPIGTLDRSVTAVRFTSAGHSCSNCEGVDPASCLFNAKEK
ncbi:hypothetical protein ACGFIW_01495 [Micromonospora sp. NPDC048935]|uniref:hypothetical protein n=1 Tax=Micromonospora sp. NPDC048935 TaxID=3364262 RepID=UPI00371643CF